MRHASIWMTVSGLPDLPQGPFSNVNSKSLHYLFFMKGERRRSNENYLFRSLLCGGEHWEGLLVVPKASKRVQMH